MGKGLTLFSLTYTFGRFAHFFAVLSFQHSVYIFLFILLAVARRFGFASVPRPARDTQAGHAPRTRTRLRTMRGHTRGTHVRIRVCDRSRLLFCS